MIVVPVRMLLVMQSAAVEILGSFTPPFSLLSCLPFPIPFCIGDRPVAGRPGVIRRPSASHPAI